MTSEQWFDEIMNTGPVFDIGQLSPQTKRMLNSKVRSGVLVKKRLLWPCITWGVREKTAYLRADHLANDRSIVRTARITSAVE